MSEGVEVRPRRLLEAYSSSWYDRFSDWVAQQKIPGWLIYLLFPLIWILLAFLIQALEGSGTIRDWEPIFYISIAQIAYFLYVIQLLDKLALSALDEFRPALNIDAEHYPALQRLISTMPARNALLSSVLLGSATGLFLLLDISSGRNSIPYTVQIGSLTSYVLPITSIVVWAVNGLFIYHTFHQLGVVSYIYTNLTTVHPFRQRELFAFSRFSAQTAIAIILLNPLWIILDPGVVSLVASTIFVLIGLIAFYLPLAGVHGLLVQEKNSLLSENARLIELVVDRLTAELSAEEPNGLETIDLSLTNLSRAKAEIEAISTWPWRAETIRQLFGAILLPLIIWLIQFFLAQVLTS
jgi:hypothetical protein